MPKKWEGPQTPSTKKRRQKVRKDGVVEGKAVPAMVFGGCMLLAGIVILLVHFL